jgi:signal transduction histidine kinase
MVGSENDRALAERHARLLSLAVHEFRTPTSVVGGYLRMLQRDSDHPLTDQQRRMIDEAEKSCARIVALVNELNEIAKLDAGAAIGSTDSFDLFDILPEVAGDMHEAKEREVHLHVRGENGGAPMRGDLARLKAAFSAFFRAILREQPSAGVVVADRRRAQRRGRNSAIVVVAPEADVQRAYAAPQALFDDRRGGLGFLLPLALRIVERHGGEVWQPASGETAKPGAGLIVALPIGEPSQ